MKSIAEHIADSLAANEIISTEDKELYVYGFHQSFVFSFNILTMCLIGYISGMLAESIIFLLAYMPIRSYAGGYHAKTPLRCYLISILIMVVALFIIRLPFWNIPVLGIAALVFAAATIITLAPVEDLNKPLNTREMAVYKKRTILILGSYSRMGKMLRSKTKK